MSDGAGAVIREPLVRASMPGTTSLRWPAQPPRPVDRHRQQVLSSSFGHRRRSPTTRAARAPGAREGMFMDRPSAPTYQDVTAARPARLSPDAPSRRQVFEQAYDLAAQIVELRERRASPSPSSPTGAAWTRPRSAASSVARGREGAKARRQSGSCSGSRWQRRRVGSGRNSPLRHQLTRGNALVIVLLEHAAGPGGDVPYLP
jgi:hypothetical protein